MAVGALFLLSFVILQQKYGQDIQNTIIGINRVLSEYHANAQVLHAFKVTGEPKVFAVIEASNFSAVECIITEILDLGSIVVDNQPIITYESFARSRGAAEELTRPVNVDLRGRKLYLATLEIEYYGKSTAEYLDLRRRSSERVLSSRINGELNAAIYKNLAERIEHFFVTVDDPEAFDLQFYQYPLLEENGANVEISTEALQLLDEYAASVCQKPGY